LLGTLLWFTISGHEIERRISVPVSYRNVPVPLELTGDQTDRVIVHVRGDDNVVSGLAEGSLRVTVDLEGSQAGPNTVPLRTDHVVAPGRVEVLQIEPGTVTVTLARAGLLSVPVKPSVEGQPAPGYVVSRVITEPSTVTVAGPESHLTGPINVITERVMIQGRTGRVVQEVVVGVDDPQLRVHAPRTVRVTVQIDPASPRTSVAPAPRPSGDR
jgi:YbbR domain-containing protein